MARRKDHTPTELRQLIRDAALDIVGTGGISGLTARKLASKIGYAPGTLYNLYPDMEAVIQDVNRLTLAHLSQYCLHQVTDMPFDDARIRALANGYYEFACTHRAAWQLLFRPVETPLWPDDYRQTLRELFDILAQNLCQCWHLDPETAKDRAILFWCGLHGITMLAQDGRLGLIGVTAPEHLIDMLFQQQKRDVS